MRRLHRLCLCLLMPLLLLGSAISPSWASGLGASDSQDRAGGYTGPHELRRHGHWNQGSGAAESHYGNRYVSPSATGQLGHLADQGIDAFTEASTLTNTAANSPAEYHVAKNGKDTNAGTMSSPFLTINRAAQVAQPGDTIIVHAGTYREWVKPPRGGISESQRIVYRAAAGETVFIKGSEQITSWTSQGNGVWKVDLDNSFFQDFNPYAMQITGGWLGYGQWHHRGDVYLDGEAYYEKQTLAEVQASPNSWFAQVTSTTTSIWAHFGATNPNTQLAEINVRECVFFPDIAGLQYVTVDGFNLAQAATNWLYDQFSPTYVDETQKGLMGPNWGKYWIIQNNVIEHSRTVGISLGYAKGVQDQGLLSDIHSRGFHQIRNNIIRRNGQAGIAGQWGAVGSEISDNLIEDINDRNEFGGAENAGIKLHYAVDVTIRHNLIRRIQSSQSWNHMGIWLDWGAQGTRITGNLIYDILSETALTMEVNHGPILIDNNVFVGDVVHQDETEAVVYAHNLFYEASPSVGWYTGTGRITPYFYPHTTLQAGQAAAVNRDDKFYNNIFMGENVGLLDVKPTEAYPGFAADWNSYVGSIAKSPYGDTNSVTDHFFDPHLVLSENTDGVSLSFSANSASFTVDTPLITSDFVGPISHAQQRIENLDGRPLSIDRDFFDNPRNLTHPIVGPFENLQPGLNTFLLWPGASTPPDPPPTFADVPFSHPYSAQIETLYRAGYIAGCSTNPLLYCPDNTMNRAESSVFVERGIHAASYDPPTPSTQVFADLALDSWAAKWVNGLWQDQYTAGCGTNPLVYCPWQGHTRAEGAVFYLRMLNGPTFEPLQPTQQTFVDVPLDAWYARWAKAAVDADLIEVCQTSPGVRFCPDDPLTRALAADMMVRAKGLNLP